MKREWLPNTVLRAASLLAPGEQRAEWLKGWQSELWYVPRRTATRFCLGAFQDALWLRRNDPGPARAWLESPLGCLAFLALLAAVGLLIAAVLPGLPRSPWAPRGPWSAQMRSRELPEACVAMLLLSCVILPTTRWVMGWAPASLYPVPWPNRLRRGIFLTLKIALVQPVMVCGLIVLILAGHVVPVVPQLAISAMWMLTLRWVLVDQRRRCPVCLRLLTNPVRIGNPSQTFLEWYGAESVCSRGHGMLQISEIPSSYSASPEWHSLDESWSDLFSETAGASPTSSRP